MAVLLIAEHDNHDAAATPTRKALTAARQLGGDVACAGGRQERQAAAAERRPSSRA